MVLEFASLLGTKHNLSSPFGDSSRACPGFVIGISFSFFHRAKISIAKARGHIVSDENDPKQLNATLINPPSTEVPKKEKRVFGDFELEKKLGQRGIGEVFLARQLSLDCHVAQPVVQRDG